MSSNHIMRVVDNDRHHETEDADALLKFSNLLLAVPTRVFWVQLEIGRVAVSKRNLRLWTNSFYNNSNCQFYCVGFRSIAGPVLASLVLAYGYPNVKPTAALGLVR